MNERVIIDKGGRIVIPKPLRERLGFEEGDLLVIEEQGGELVVRHEDEEGGLVRRGKRLFKPRDRKAGAIDTKEINRLIEIMRDPEARSALETQEAKKAAGKRRAAKKAGR